MKSLIAILFVLVIATVASAETRAFPVKCASQLEVGTTFTSITSRQLLVDASADDVRLSVGPHSITISNYLSVQSLSRGLGYYANLVLPDLTSVSLQFFDFENTMRLITYSAAHIQAKAIFCEGAGIRSLMNELSGRSDSPRTYNFSRDRYTPSATGSERTTESSVRDYQDVPLLDNLSALSKPSTAVPATTTVPAPTAAIPSSLASDLDFLQQHP